MPERKIPGKGNAHTKLLTFQNAVELIMVLPGHVAKEIRMQFSSIIQRYLAGDHTLNSEIQVNAASSSPVARMARESLGIVSDEDMLPHPNKLPCPPWISMSSSLALLCASK
jgi:hypothetical protein